MASRPTEREEKQITKMRKKRETKTRTQTSVIRTHAKQWAIETRKKKKKRNNEREIKTDDEIVAATRCAPAQQVISIVRRIALKMVIRVGVDGVSLAHPRTQAPHSLDVQTNRLNGFIVIFTPFSSV